MKITKKNRKVILLFLIPSLLIYLFFVLYPIAQSLINSTYQWTSIDSKRFVGLENYKMVFRDKVFWKSVKNSLYFMAASTVAQVVAGFILGYILYLQPKGFRIFKTILFVPTVMASVAVSFIWSYIYNPTMGIVKPVLDMLGMGAGYVSPLASSKTAMIAVIFAQVWCSVGTQMIMFNAGFMDMSEEVLESAEIDGCSGLKTIRYMVIPMTKGTIQMVIILQLISSLRAFDLIYTMTSGGPNHATKVLPMYLFNWAFQKMNFGNGSVVSTVIFALCMIITLIMRKTLFPQKKEG